MVADRENPVAHGNDVTDDRGHLLSLGNIGATKVHTAGRTELWFSLPGVRKGLMQPTILIFLLIKLIIA